MFFPPKYATNSCDFCFFPSKMETSKLIPMSELFEKDLLYVILDFGKNTP